jgi:hypothetical protein
MTLYDFLCHRMFYGNDKGVTTIPVKDLLEEIVEYVDEWEDL